MATDWREMALGDVIMLQRGHDLPIQDRKPGEIPVVTSAGISGTHSEPKAKAPGVVMGRYGTLGEIYYLREDYWPHNTTLYVKDFKGNDPHYIYYLLKTLDFTAHNDKTSVPGLNRNHLHTIRVKFTFDVAEQRAIAHILGSLDDKIELNRRMNATLEESARALFKSWFVDFDPVRAKMEGRQPEGIDAETAALFPDRLVESTLGLIPEGWGVQTLGEISEKPQYGFTASASNEPVGPKFLRIMDINKSPWIQWETVPYCHITDHEFPKYALKKGDVVIARMADPGHGALIEQEIDAVFASYLIRFRPRIPAYVRYVQYWLRSAQYWQIVDGLKTGTTRSSLNAQVLNSFRLLVPPEVIALCFAQFVNNFRDQIVENNSQSYSLAATRDALLPQLLSGEVKIN